MRIGAALTVALATVVAAVPIHAGAREFHGYECTDDCSGHIAGYRWAQAHSISDEADCGGNSNSFYEGCLAYVQDQGWGGDEADDDEDCDRDTDTGDCEWG